MAWRKGCGGLHALVPGAFIQGLQGSRACRVLGRKVQRIFSFRVEGLGLLNLRWFKAFGLGVDSVGFPIPQLRLWVSGLGLHFA